MPYQASMQTCSSTSKILKAVIILLTVIIATTILTSCSSADDIDYAKTVRTSTPFIHDGDTTTVGDVVNRFFTAPIWRERTESRNLTYVDIRGVVQDVDGRRLNIVLTYRVTPDSGRDDYSYTDPVALEISGTIFGADAAESFEIDLFDAYEGGYESLSAFFISMGYSQGIAQTFRFYFEESSVVGGLESGHRNNDTQLTFGSTFEYLGFEITIGDSWSFDNWGQIEVPITVTNINNESGNLATGERVWCPNGLLRMGGMGSLNVVRVGVTQNTSIWFGYYGDGDYVIEIYDWLEAVHHHIISGDISDSIGIVITLPISQQGVASHGADTGGWQDAGEVLIPPDWHIDDSMDSLVVFGMVGGQEIELVANWIEEDFQWLVESATSSSQFTFDVGGDGYRLEFPEEIMWINPHAHRALVFRHRGQTGLRDSARDITNEIARTLRNPWMD